MEEFQSTIKKYFYISIIFFLVGISYGFLYSLNLLGFISDSKMLDPTNVRSIHISLMLYGFIPLMLSYLPFFIIVKDTEYKKEIIRYLEIYTIIWYVFLIALFISISMGVKRNLQFYDFHYSLNGLLVLAGFFYLKAIFEYAKLYNKKPQWLKISLIITILSPFILIFLMNPNIGQVESTIYGPHGDNTLGMSLALIPIYFLIIKYLSIKKFEAKWNILWIIPAIFYLLSIMHRIFIGNLSYNQEWFFQWLSLLYVPLLIKWYKDAEISNIYLKISLLSFIFIDIEGNLIFIESIRWMFHRTDLVIAHAHVAMGISILFLTLSLYSNFIKELFKSYFLKIYIFGQLGIFISLSISGFVQAGYFDFDIQMLWLLRSMFGFFVILSVLIFLMNKLIFSKLNIYNLIGALSDGIGAIILFIIGDSLFNFAQIKFYGIYQYVVFGFVFTTGFIHFLAIKNKKDSIILTQITVMIRFLIGAIFLSLFLSKNLGIESLIIFSYDFLFALIYLIYFFNTKNEKYHA